MTFYILIYMSMNTVVEHSSYMSEQQFCSAFLNQMRPAWLQDTARTGYRVNTASGTVVQVECIASEVKLREVGK